MGPWIKHQTTLSANVVLLCRFLRVKGFAIGPTEEADALRAISYLPINSEYYFQEGLKTVLSKNVFQRSKFDEYYAEFKDQLSKASDSKVKEKFRGSDTKAFFGFKRGRDGINDASIEENGEEVDTSKKSIKEKIEDSQKP